MLIRSPRLGPAPIAFDPVAVGAKQLVGARDASKRGVFQVCTNAIEMGKTYTMAGSQFRATTASHMVDLQGSNVCASPRAVIVVPATAGIAATFSELRHDLGAQFPLSYSALTLSHVYIIHSHVPGVNQSSTPCRGKVEMSPSGAK
jgi:hypothetical protein